jgi:hypothetical protein
LSEPFHTPPVTHNPDGEERRAGFELEFTGIDMGQAAEVIRQLFGGEVVKISTFEFRIPDTRFGTFKLELDALVFREKRYEKYFQKVGLNLKKVKRKDDFESSLLEMASTVVPYEIVSPPLPISKLDDLNTLANKLRSLKVKGTGSSFMYAFGLHINPEVPNEEPDSLLDHLRAYVMLDPWIRKDASIDLSRRISPYINPYEENYIQHILNPDYQPDTEQLIRDYFRFDNSRNRPLDMLPVFMHLKPTLTGELIGEELTSSRPAYHYRLPNCSLEDPDWTIAGEWNRWVLVEKLASDKQALNQYSRAWLRMKAETLIRFEHKWVTLMNRWRESI